MTPATKTTALTVVDAAPRSGSSDATGSSDTEAGRLADALRRWLGSGRCQGPSGAFCAWRARDTGALAYEYPEITGYALTWFAGRPSPSSGERQSAERAADWLVSRVAAGDLAARSGWDQEAVYAFDLAIIGTGLLVAARALARDDLLDVGIKLAGRLAHEIAKTGGLVPLLGVGARSERSAWSTEGRAHLLKAVQCLLIAETLGAQDTGPAADTLFADLAKLQDSDGRFVTQERQPTMLHPHLYALEGLWLWGTAREDETALELARTGLAWAWAQQLSSGGLPRQAAQKRLEQADATAQAVRLSCLLDFGRSEAARAVETLVAVAIPDGEGAALPYQPAATEVHLNSWSTLFGAQALELAASPAPQLSWEDLV